MKKFGLTGGVACGKTTVSQALETLGWAVIDADEIVARLYEPGGAGQQKIIDTFGRAMLNEDQAVNRALLGRLVFSDSDKRRLLNSLIHPLVKKVWQQQYQEHLKRSKKPVVIVIPLLFEAKVEKWFDSVACVGCSEKEQKKRLKAQKRELIEERINAQLPLAQKMEKSQIILWNNGSMEHLNAQARALDAFWRRM